MFICLRRVHLIRFFCYSISYLFIWLRRAPFGRFFCYSKIYLFIWLRRAPFGRFFCLPKSFLLSLSWCKESKQRKIKAADNFGAPVLRLAHAIQLPRAKLGVKQYCLLKAYAASLKTVALSQNSLRPFEIQKKRNVRELYKYRRAGYPEMARTSDKTVAPIKPV